ncbi:MAG TPA: hypothetical protein VN703_09880 [Candidatus Sulfopaludibacter sp.]|nr:hypothetical protein [Candidatus Sulfopaludibacter sp.]
MDKLSIEPKEINKAKVGLRAISLSRYMSSFTWLCRNVISFAIQSANKEGIALEDIPI